MEDRRIRRSALPSVWPKPRSRGSRTTLARLLPSWVTSIERGVRSSVAKVCIRIPVVSLTNADCSYSTHLLRVKLYNKVFVDISGQLSSVGIALIDTSQLACVHFDPIHRTTLGSQLNRRLNTQLLLRLLA